MFEKILIAIDFSSQTQKILECIGGISGVKEVVLLHVFDATKSSIHGWTYGPAIENAKILLDEKKKYLEAHGYVVTANVEVLTGGDIYQEILITAENQKVSLIVTGARGKSLMNEILLGSVSQNILRHAKTSVLVYHDIMTDDLSASGYKRTCPALLSNVLLPTDFSPHSRNIALWAKGVREIGKITLLHVIERGETEHEIENVKHQVQKNLDEFARIFADTGIMVKTQIRVGNRVEMIFSAAESDNASVILMSPHGTGGFLELYIGSITLKEVKRTKRPVLMVRTGVS
jgi:nucleotide-binding universal stress UspA family protein